MKLILRTLVFSILIGGYALSAWGDESWVALVSADKAHVVLELTTPGMSIEERRHAGSVYHLIAITGFGRTGEIGRPQLPVRGALIGLPPNGGFKVEILDAPFRILSGYRIYPSPRPTVNPDTGVLTEEFTVDSGIYSTEEFYPNVIVKEGFSGYMRDQRVAQVLFYPVQFNPVSGQIKVHETIRVRISFEDPFPSASGQTFSGITKPGLTPDNPYEMLLKELLLNYSSLGRGN